MAEGLTKNKWYDIVSISNFDLNTITWLINQARLRA